MGFVTAPFKNNIKDETTTLLTMWCFKAVLNTSSDRNVSEADRVCAEVSTALKYSLKILVFYFSCHILLLHLRQILYFLLQYMYLTALEASPFYSISHQTEGSADILMVGVILPVDTFQGSSFSLCRLAYLNVYVIRLRFGLNKL